MTGTNVNITSILLRNPTPPSSGASLSQLVKSKNDTKTSVSIVASSNLWQTAQGQLVSDVIYLYSANYMQLAGKMLPSNAILSVDCPNIIHTDVEENEVFQGKVVLSFVDPKKNPSTPSSPQLMTAVELVENIRAQKSLSYAPSIYEIQQYLSQDFYTTIIALRRLDVNSTASLKSPSFGIYSSSIDHVGKIDTTAQGCTSDLGPGRGS